MNDIDIDPRSDRPNAFLFKLEQKDGSRVCICPRFNGKWQLEEAFYVEEFKEQFEDVLDHVYFSIIFINVIKDETEFGFDFDNSTFAANKNVTFAELYTQNKLASSVEELYNNSYPMKDHHTNYTSSVDLE